MIEPTDEMRAAVRRRMGAPDGQELDPWMGAAIEDVMALVERDMLARVEGKRGEGLCTCSDADDPPINVRTGLAMEHHCDCDAVTAAGLLAGDRRRTRHVAECICDWDAP